MPFSDAQRKTRERALAEGMSPQEQVEARILGERREEEARKAFNDYVSGVMTEISRAYEAGAPSYTFSLGPDWDKARWERLQANYPYGHTVIDLTKAAEAVTEHMLKEDGLACEAVGKTYVVRF